MFYHPGCYSSHKTQKAMLNCDKVFGVWHITDAGAFGDHKPRCDAPNRRKDSLIAAGMAYVVRTDPNRCKVCFKDES